MESRKDEKRLLEAAITRVEAELPRGWRVTKRIRAPRAMSFDGCLEVAPARGDPGWLLVEVKTRTPYPRELEDWAARATKLIARSAQKREALVLVAPYVGPEARRVLADSGIGWIDMTGNLSIVLAEPATVIKAKGVDRNPDPDPEVDRSLGGSKALAVVRTLVDFLPPLSASDIARESKTTLGYVSKLLVKLAREGLVEREARGPVTAVRWQRVIEECARDFDLLESGHWSSYVTAGWPMVRSKLSDLAASGERVALTAARSFESVASVGSSRVFCYVENATRVAAALDARPWENGMLVLLEPRASVVFERLRDVDGLPCVAYSQAAIDCLAGPDRMPEAGKALLDWMQANEKWRKRMGGGDPE